MNASSLYDALKSKALSSYPASKRETQFLQFHGSHSIIAVSYIGHIKRLKIVVNDLRKIARLSFTFVIIFSMLHIYMILMMYFSLELMQYHYQALLDP